MSKSTISKKELDARIKKFTDAVFRYQKLLGFTEVTISVMSQIKPDTRASWYGHASAGLLSVCYSEDWIRKSDTEYSDIDKTAFHEVYEAQLHELYELLEVFYASDYIAEKMHRLVRKAENTIYPILADRKAIDK